MVYGLGVWFGRGACVAASARHANHAPKLASDKSDIDKPIGMQAAVAAMTRAAASAAAAWVMPSKGMLVASAWFGAYGCEGLGFGAGSDGCAGFRVQGSGCGV